MKSAAERYRLEYQASFVPKWYRPRVHLAFVFAFGGTMIAGLLVSAWSVLTPADLIAIPATLLIANFVEYCAHRGPMHHETTFLRPLFERHTRRHHRYFNAAHMELDGTHDFHATLFPAVLLLFFGAIALSLGALVALALPWHTAAVFVATAVAYYLAYEMLHLAYHLPVDHWLARVPPVPFLARHHRIHHDGEGMRQCNFNLVAPLFDVVFGTLRTESVRRDVAIGQERAARIR